jgi:hypothetical protein
MSNPQERRQYPRADVEWPVTFLTPQDKTIGKTENISAVGAFISCEVFPASEDNLRMVIKAPGYRPMNIAGKVVWSKVLNSTKSSPSYGLGIKFTEISENDRHFLKNLFFKRNA